LSRWGPSSFKLDSLAIFKFEKAEKN
jgi:hypothetical protein